LGGFTWTIVVCCLSPRGGQYTSLALAETLVLEGIAASIGSVGDAYDKGLAS
jgi:putative transposase